MAQVPLNKFRRILAPLSADVDTSVLYTAPTQRVTIVLNAQAANLTANTATVTFGISSQSTDTFFTLVSAFEVPANDATSLTTGKLVLDAGDSIYSYSSTAGSISLSLSLLETFNES